MSVALDIQEHVDWVRKLAGRLAGKGYGFTEDLYQEGMMGLMQAAARFNPTQNRSFKRYAYARVRGSMVDWLRKFLPGTRQRNKPFRAVFVDSIDRVVNAGDKEGVPLMVSDTVGHDGVIGKRRFRILCQEVLAPRELRIIQHVYFDGGTARALRDELGISESQISHIHSKAKEKLREAIGEFSEIEDFEGAIGGRKVKRGMRG